jgi:hypothetical protein
VGGETHSRLAAAGAIDYNRGLFGKLHHPHRWVKR